MLVLVFGLITGLAWIKVFHSGLILILTDTWYYQNTSDGQYGSWYFDIYQN